MKPVVQVEEISDVSKVKTGDLRVVVGRGQNSLTSSVGSVESQPEKNGESKRTGRLMWRRKYALS